MLRFSVRAIALVALISVLQACGGGGGGKRDNAFTIHPDRTSVAFDYVQGATAQSQVINATWTGTPPDPVYIAAQLQGTGLSPNIPVAITQTNATVTLRPASGLLAGQYGGTVQMFVCTDPGCTQRVGGTPISITYTINIRAPVFNGPAQVSFSHTRFTPNTVTGAVLNVTSAAGAWTATSSSPRITLSPTSGNGAAAVTVGINPAAITSGGTFNDTVTITGANGTQSSVVSLSVFTPSITANPVTFAGINGSMFGSQNANVTVSMFNGGGAASLPLTATTTTPWLTVNSATASASTTAPGTLTLSVNPSVGPLASGTHAGSVRLQMGTATDNTVVTMDVTLQLTAATLTITPATLVLGGNVGRTFSAESVSLSLNTGTQAHGWSVGARPSWVTLDRASGSINATGQSVALTPQRLQATPGTSSTTLTFSTQINGDVVTANLPVSFNLDQHRLIASENGIAFVDLPTASWDRVTRTVRVRDNLGLNTAWTASSDQPWLQVTSSGTTGTSSDLILTANTTGLTPDTVSIATVTVSASADTTVTETERIRVGLWVGATTPSGPTSKRPLSNYFEAVATDPIRPYVYAYEGRSGQIRVFNIYDGTELAPITGLPETFGLLRHLVPSSDGDQLFIYQGFDCQLIPIDLNARTVGAPLESCADPRVSVARTQFAYARPNGVGVVLNDYGEVMLASTGRNVAVGGGFFGPFAVTGDSRRAFAIASYAIDFTSARGGEFTRDQVDVLDDFIVRVQATNYDGSRLYALENASRSTLNAEQNRVRAANGLTGALLGDLSTGLVYEALAVTRDDRVFFTSNEGFHAYGPDHAPLITPVQAETFLSQIRVSGDGHFGVVFSGQSESLKFIPVAP